jgi:hypothetical protein
MTAIILASAIAIACTSLAIYDLRTLLRRRARTRALLAQEWIRTKCADVIREAERQHGPRKGARLAQVAATHRALELAIGREP